MVWPQFGWFRCQAPRYYPKESYPYRPSSSDDSADERGPIEVFRFAHTLGSFREEWREFDRMRGLSRREEYEWKLTQIDTLVNTCANQIGLSSSEVKRAACKAREECERLADRKRNGKLEPGRDGRILKKISVYQKRLPQLRGVLAEARELYFEGRVAESDFSLSDESSYSSYDSSSSSSSS